jgi:hypothetical protein
MGQELVPTWVRGPLLLFYGMLLLYMCCPSCLLKAHFEIQSYMYNKEIVLRGFAVSNAARFSIELNQSISIYCTDDRHPVWSKRDMRRALVPN